LGREKIFGQGVRPLQLPDKSVQRRREKDQRDVRADVRRLRYDIAVRRTARPGDRRPGLRREHRGVLHRVDDILQRAPAGESGAHKSMI